MNSLNALRERIRIEYPATSDDGYGGKTVLWETLADSWAFVQAMPGGSESLIADQRVSSSSYRLTLRHRTDITASMRIQWKHHTLLIHSLHDQGEYLSILAYEEHL